MYLPARESRAGHRDAPRWGIPFIRREIDTLFMPVAACFRLFLPVFPSLSHTSQAPSFPLSSHRSLFCSSLSSSSSPSSSSLSPPSSHSLILSTTYIQKTSCFDRTKSATATIPKSGFSKHWPIYMLHSKPSHSPHLNQAHFHHPSSHPTTHQRHHQPNVCSCCHPTRRFRAITSEWTGIRSVCQAWISVQTPLILLTLPSRSKTLQRALA